MRRGRIFLVVITFLLCARLVAAQQEPILLWGADAKSDAPYSFVDPADQRTLEGFEKEIMDAVAKRMGRQAKLVQNDWGTLIPGLYRHLYDVVINGLEITNDRAGAVDFSIPYYYTFEQLAVRATDHEIDGLAGLRGRSVGTLKATLAERILEKTGDINVKVYDDEVAAYSDLVNGRIDAVLLDYPIALYYAAPNPALKLVGPPIGKLRYGIAMRKGDTELEKQVNQSLQAVIDSGELRTILERWKLWTPMMADELNDSTLSNVAPVEYVRFIAATAPLSGWQNIFWRYVSFLPMLAKAAVVTLEVSILGMVLAVGVGLALAVVRQYGPTLLSAPPSDTSRQSAARPC